MTPLALLLLLSTQRPIHPSPDVRTSEPTAPTALTSGGRVWTYRADIHFPRIALGDRGGQVLAHTNQDELLLFSSFDANPPTPVWRSPNVHLSYPYLVAAADTDVYFIADYRDDRDEHTDALVLQKYRSRSSVPEWRHSFAPPQFEGWMSYDVSRDGETIVSNFDNWWEMENEIRVHDPATGLPTRTIVIPYLLDAGYYTDLSPDGSVAAATISPYESFVFEPATGRELGTIQGAFMSRQALSENGRVLALRSLHPSYEVHVLRRTPAGYVPAFEIPAPPDTLPWGCVVSDDGSTVAVTWKENSHPATLSIVSAHDVATGRMTMEHVDLSPAGGLELSDLAISADGSVFVVGLTAFSPASVSELAVYSRDSDQPIREHPNLGAVFEVELSPDGKRYAAVRALHDACSSPCVVELYELGGEDLVVRGAPEIGATIAFELHGTPGSRATLLRSSALAIPPIDVPGVGTLHLDPATLSRTAMGVVPPSGVATTTTILGTDPSLIGRTYWFQGLTNGPRRLTEDFVQVTILP